MNDSNKATDIEVAVDKCLDYQVTLRVPYVNPNYYHIGFRGYFDNMWFRYGVDIVKYMCWFDEKFHHFRVNRYVSIFHHIGNAKDFKIWFQLEKLCVLNILEIYIVAIFDILANYANIC